MSELSGVVKRIKSRGPRTEPCGTPQVRGHDWDDALVFWCPNKLPVILYAAR